MKKVSIGRYIFGIFTAIIAVLAGFVVSLVFWVLRTWANLKADELIYQFNAPMQGTNKEMIMDACFLGRCAGRSMAAGRIF